MTPSEAEPFGSEHLCGISKAKNIICLFTLVTRAFWKYSIFFSHIWKQYYSNRTSQLRRKIVLPLNP